MTCPNCGQQDGNAPYDTYCVKCGALLRAAVRALLTKGAQ